MRYALQKRSGILKRRFATVPFDRVQLADHVHSGTPTVPEAYRQFREGAGGRFFFAPGRLPDAALLDKVVSPTGRARTIAVADDYRQGRFLYYNRHVRDLGRPVHWLMNPFSDASHNAQVHWCNYATFSTEASDIKDVWEPSRFACSYWLARAYALTGDEAYPEAFWTMFESWCRQNPHNMGPNWKCGQETALRSMAWCFAMYAFWNAESTTPSRIVDMVKLLALQAHRIAGNIGYAVSQKNNHAISEAVGLLTTSWLFPELRGSDHWQKIGRGVLEREVARQVYDDGSYVQHSMNYHRVILHTCLWAIRLAELNDRPLSQALTQRISQAGNFLYEMLDSTSGHVPNYGANDGALPLPLTACDYREYRPTVQASAFHASGKRLLREGPWDEMLLWLYGDNAVRSDVAEGESVSSRFDAGGYYTLRKGDSWCMVRCHTYRDRPTHVDMMHVDLWHCGINVLSDSGTYKYFVPDDLAMERFFKDIRAHNTIEVGGVSPLRLASRFLWLPWSAARCLEHSATRWSGENYAYRRSPHHVVHRRTIDRLADSQWCITDELTGTGVHAVTLRWHLCDRPTTLQADRMRLLIDLPSGSASLSVQTPAGMVMSVDRGTSESGRIAGWESRYYGERTPRPTVEVSGQCQLPAIFTTRITFQNAESQ